MLPVVLVICQEAMGSLIPFTVRKVQGVCGPRIDSAINMVRAAVPVCSQDYIANNDISCNAVPPFWLLFNDRIDHHDNTPTPST
jgi:hypothetical protein